MKLPDTLRPQLHWGLMEGTGMETTLRQALRAMKTDCTGSEHQEHDRSCDTTVTTFGVREAEVAAAWPQRVSLQRL